MRNELKIDADARRAAKPKMHGAFCPTCFACFMDTSPSPWSWQKSQAMHERGTGHKMKRFNRNKIDWLALAYNNKLIFL